MISVIRKKFKKRGLQILVGVVLLSIFGADFVRRQGAKTYKSVAVINGYEVTPAEFRSRVMEEEKLLSYYQEQYGKNAKEFLAAQGVNTNPEDAAMEKLIREKVILSAADKLGINPSPDFISQQLADPQYSYKVLAQFIPIQLLYQENFNIANLPAYLRKQGISMSKFEEMVEELIKRYSVFDIVQGAVYVPNAVLKEAFEKRYSKKRFSVLTFDFEKYLSKAKQEKLTEEEIKSYFDTATKNKKYWVPEKRSGIVWKIDAAAYNVKVTDREIENYFDRNKAEEFKDKKFADVKNQIRSQLTQEKFERLFTLDAQRIANESKNNSKVIENFANSKNGVKTTIAMTDANSSNPAAKKLFSLKAGQKTYYVEGNFGYLVELSKIAQSYKPELNEVKETVINDIYKTRAKKMILADVEKANEDFKDSTPEAIAEKFGLQIQKSDWVSPQSNKIEFLDKLKLPQQVATAMSVKGMHMMYPGINENMFAIFLTDIEPFNATLFSQKKAELMKEVQHEETSKVIYSFIDSLIKSAKIKYNLKTA